MIGSTATPDLAGLRILVPRADEWGRRVGAAITARGGEATAHALIETRPAARPAELSAAVARWHGGEFDCLAVTSRNGAAALAAEGIRAVPGTTVAAVGPATARALVDIGLAPTLQPASDFSSAGLADAIAGSARGPQRILLPVSDRADGALPERLRAAGHRVERIEAYRTRALPADPALGRALAAGRFDAVLVTSGSAAQALAEHYPTIHPRVALAAIGEPTALALERLGMPARVVGRVQTADGLLDALAETLIRIAHPAEEALRREQ